jgi:DNA (cytosine-5)-methyltransferase 1
MTRVLDGCCGAGGTGAGLAAAGLDVHGVDSDPAVGPDYLRSGASSFTCADILDVLASPWLRSFAAAVVGPPCQHYSQMSRCRPGLAAHYPELITPVRGELDAWGGPYVIENVEAARPWMKDPVTLCGWMFGRETYRHRLLEAGGGLVLAQPPQPPPGTPGRLRSCGWPHPVPAARAGHWEPGRFVSVSGHERKEPVRRVMEIGWMADREHVAEAVPPYMARWAGDQIAAHLSVDRTPRSG